MTKDEAFLLIAPIRAISEAAGDEIMPFFRRPGLTVKAKHDGSPVTDADMLAERLILSALRELTPMITVISEEAVAAGTVPVPPDGLLWLVDPLDGTKDFIDGRAEFTVNIALVDGDQLKLGVVHQPASHRIYAGAGLGTATRRCNGLAELRIRVRSMPKEGATLAVSRSHEHPEAIQSQLKGQRVVTLISIGSSLKFCLVADGTADLYIRTGPTREWDTAAGHAIVLAAGGRVTTFDGAPLRYGKTPQSRFQGFGIARHLNTLNVRADVLWDATAGKTVTRPVAPRTAQLKLCSCMLLKPTVSAGICVRQPKGHV